MSVPGLLERAAGYGLPIVEHVPPGRLGVATPCAGWDLARLLRHLGESLAALHEAAELGCVGPVPVGPDGPPPGTALPEWVAGGIRCLRRTWRHAEDEAVLVGDRALRAEVVEIVAALEIAVHGWDVSAACGRPRPIPVRLALELTRALPLVADGLIRPGLFALPVPAPALGSPGDRLVALLGRHPSRDEFSFRTES